MEFNPENYKIDVIKIIHKLNETEPWDICIIPEAEDFEMKETKRHIEKGTIREFGKKEVQAIQDLTKDMKGPLVRRTSVCLRVLREG